MIHSSVPIFNAGFLQFLLEMFVDFRDQLKSNSVDISIWSLNISPLNLPSIKSPSLIDAYETVLAIELSDPPQAFSIAYLMDLLQKNQNFANYGFYRGFGDLLFNAILTDPRSQSEAFIVSTILRFYQLNVRDPTFVQKVNALLEANAERYSNVYLLKYVVALMYHDP